MLSLSKHDNISITIFTLPLDKLGVNLAQGDISDSLPVCQYYGLSEIKGKNIITSVP